MDKDMHLQVGKLEANVEKLQQDMAEVKTDIKTIAGFIQKWKGIAVGFMILGAIITAIVDFLLSWR